MEEEAVDDSFHKLLDELGIAVDSENIVVSCDCLEKKCKVLPSEHNAKKNSMSVTDIRKNKLKKLECICLPTSTESELNSIDVTFCHSDMTTEFAFGRDKLCTIDKLYSCEFLAGQNVHVKLCLMRDESLPMKERIIVSISSGVNEVHMSARDFFKRFIPKVENSFSKGLDHLLSEDSDEFKIELGIFGQCIKKSDGLWVVVRKYIKYHVVDRVYMCGKTYCDVKRSLPAMKKCFELYLSYLIAGRASDIEQNFYSVCNVKTNVM